LIQRSFAVTVADLWTENKHDGPLPASRKYINHEENLVTLFALPFTSLRERILFISLYISAPGFEDVVHLPAISGCPCNKVQEKKNYGEAKQKNDI